MRSLIIPSLPYGRMDIVRWMARPKLLGVLLSYNDGDLVADTVTTMLDQGHDLVVFEHGSDPETRLMWDPFIPQLMEFNEVPREFDFYELYPHVSRHILEKYSGAYDWVSWPDFDEFLEGPNRSKPYHEWVADLVDSPYDWIEFRNMNYWWTVEDDSLILSPLERVRRYSWFQDCAPRRRSWRASATNLRIFNHNEPLGACVPELFNLRHYPMRDRCQMERRLSHDRAGIRRGDANYHYENMEVRRNVLEINPSDLHFDDGSELSLEPIFNWRSIYGSGASK